MTILEKQLIARLKGRNAWLTGGKRVGRVIARALAEQGVNLAVSYRRSSQEAEETVREAEALGVQAMAVQCDVSSRESVERAADQIRQRFQSLDILVNMASVFAKIPFEKVSQKDWEENVGAHIYGTFWPIQCAAPFMPPGSHIINISDRTSIGRVYPGYAPYVVTKAAVDAITRDAARELAERGIVVNAIAPGPILPPEATPGEEWQANRAGAALKLPFTDEEAMEQFALLVLYLSAVTMASGRTYALDQGKNL